MAHRIAPILLVLATLFAACGEDPTVRGDLGSLGRLEFDAGEARLPTIMASAAPEVPASTAPVVKVGDRVFISLGRADAFVGDATGAIELVHLASYRTAAARPLPPELREAFAAWSGGPLTVLDRRGLACALPSREVTILSSDESPEQALEVDCDGEPYDACIERALGAEQPEVLFARGEKTFVAELVDLGACEEPVLARLDGAAGAAEVAMHVDAELLPPAWSRLVESQPAHRENQRRHRREALASGEIAEAAEAWVELTELAQAFRFEGDPFAYVLVHFVPWCGGDREPLSVLVRQPLGEGEPALVPLAPGFEPHTVSDLVRRDGALEFVGWLDETSHGFIATNGEARETFRTRWSGCGC